MNMRDKSEKEQSNDLQRRRNFTKKKSLTARGKKKLEQEAIEKEKEESIYDGTIHLFGKEVAFERREIEEYGLSILMPAEFEELDEESKEAIYPYGKAPKYAFASGDIPFQMTLNLTESIVPNDGIPKFMEMVQKVMERIGPQARILSNVVVQKEERNVGLMEIATNAVDMAVYNTQFYLSLDKDRLFIGAVTCPAKRHNRMVPLIKEILDSIIVKEDVKDGNNHTCES